MTIRPRTSSFGWPSSGIRQNWSADNSGTRVCAVDIVVSDYVFDAVVQINYIFAIEVTHHYQ
jgi:hypothetical protein